jgi:hypothetical protein
MCILKYGSILNTPRNFICSLHPKIKELFNCSLCLGFWVGLFIGICEYHVFRNDINYFYLPFVSAGVCWFLDSTLRSIQTIELFLDKKLEDIK